MEVNVKSHKCLYFVVQSVVFEENNTPNIMIGKMYFRLKFFVFTDDLELHILIEKYFICYSLIGFDLIFCSYISWLLI